ncbi:sulfide:quinone oxidoreductase, mitochondrial-like [Littorina saxatilis]|uniref:Sulfide:quinone oxidoreductase, mitochondrial n=1 Tax=Littorina saxatilis TaxID=31220 RepID=A0AAN9AZT6_9CAEN
MAFRRNMLKSAVRCFSQTDTLSMVRHFSCTNHKGVSYKLVVVGGGSGGCATAAKFCRELGKGQVAVIEPSETHAYQPIWTLVGAGLKTLEQSLRPMSKVLPSECDWIKDSAVKFDPKNNYVETASGKKIEYEYLVVATGLQLNYDKVKGLTEALRSDPQVCSNYHAQYVTKTFPALEAVEGGNAIFTFPNTPIKCAGAPQKIMYLAEEIFRNRGKRDKTNVIFNTSLPVIFGVKKYAESLQHVIKERNIKVNYRHNLVEVKPDKREAVFQLLDSEKGETKTFEYSFLHATPPMSAPDVVRSSPLVNADGWVDVNKQTLQHNKFPNVFSIGDCSSLPTSKTAAAVAAQSGVLKNNLTAVMKGGDLSRSYDGYTSCPLITGKDKCILAEFDYDAQPLETFPVDQGKERWSMYQMKAQVMPELYWNVMTKGLWQGPAIFRKLMHLGMGR